MSDRVVKLVTNQADANIVGIIEGILERAKKGEIVALLVCCATPTNWEWEVSAGTPMLEAMGQIEVVKDALRCEYVGANEN